MLDPSIKVYVGGNWRPTFPDTNFQAEPPSAGKLATNLTLVSSSYDMNLGGTITLTATLKRNATGLNAKSIVFEEYVSGAWVTLDTETTNASGIATTSPAVAPTASRKYRAKFAGDASYVASTSKEVNVTIRTLQQVTQRFYAIWSQVYKDDNTQATETDVRQTTNSGSKRKSLIGFSETAMQAFLSGYVDEIRVKFSWVGDPRVEENVGGTGLIGLHDYNAKPTTWSDARVVQNQWTLAASANGSRTTLDSDLGDWDETTVIPEFASGSAIGISAGPATSDSSVYKIYAYGAYVNNDPYEPWIEFTVTKWV